MKIFVAGATGVLGRRAVPLLIAAGHHVTAVARNPEKADLVHRLGATPSWVDLFDAEAVRAAVAGHDVVINLATHIPSLTKASWPGAWSENDRVRTEISKHLVDAAMVGGARRYIQESITMVYADGGDRWLDETTPFGPSPFAGPVKVAEANAARFTEPEGVGRVGIVLRFAMFYGDGASHTADQLRLARQGIAPVVGRADAYQSMIHLHDAATAVVAALDAPAGVYNLAEDHPGTRQQQAAAIAAALGRPPLWLTPPALAKAGGWAGAAMSGSQRVSNRAFRDATGWAPAYPDPWTGWREVVGPPQHAPKSERRRRILVRASLIYLAFQAAMVGVWATFAPQSFYTSFPGGGRHWVAVDGPYNHHLATDTGGLFLALLVLTVVAAGSRSRVLMRTAGLAWVVSALPHFLYHLTHRHGLGSADLAASIGGIGLQVILGALVVVLAPAAPVTPAPVTPASVTPAPVTPALGEPASGPVSRAGVQVPAPL